MPTKTPETFEDKLARNAYRTALPYLSNKEDPRGHKDYQDDNIRLYDEFKKDLFEALGITENPKANKLLCIAEEKGHAFGYSEIYNEALDLVDLIK
jgi:hypothetical protein